MEPVKVYARLRPAVDADAQRCVKTMGGEVLVERNSFDTARFGFTGVLGEGCGQEEVYDAATGPLLRDALAGVDASLICYGQTGTGKTHTVRGAVARCVGEIYHSRQQQKVEVLGIHIYKENITDVSTGKTITVLSGGKVSLRGAEWVAVGDADTALGYINECEGKRVVRATDMNQFSSRSHFSITFRFTSPNGRVVSHFSIVDLAGSERFSKDRADETKFINKSLMCLGSVVSSLASKLPHVPFRESALTKYLEPSLTGSGRAVIIVTLNTDFGNVSESLATCQFGSRAMKVTTRPMANSGEEEEDSWGVKEWREQCITLKAKLAETRDHPEYHKNIAELFETRSENARLTAEVEVLRKGSVRASAQSATESHLSQAVRRIETLNKRLLEFRKSLSEKTEVIATLETEAKQRAAYVFELEKMAETKSVPPVSNAAYVLELEKMIEAVEGQVEVRDSDVARLQDVLRQKDTHTTRLEEMLKTNDSTIDRLRQLLLQSDERVATLRKDLADRQTEAKSATSRAAAAEVELATLRQQFTALAEDMTERELVLARDRGAVAAEREATQAVLDTFARKVRQREAEITDLKEQLRRQ